VVADRDKAKGIAQYRKMKERDAQLAKSSRVSLEGLAEQIRTAGVKDLGLIIKGDVTGSVEVLADSLVLMSTEKVRVKVIHSGVGSITESDVLLAAASNALIIGFNVRPERKAAELANQENVEIRLHSIIYELQDEMRLAMLGLLEPVFKENYIGRAEVINVFHIPKIGTIAGCRVQDGVIRRDAEVKVMRGDERIFKGKVHSLKRFKDDAKEVTNGMECGIGLGGFSVRPERKAAELAQQEDVEIRLHSIIYELQDEMRLAMLGLLEPTFKENYVGRAEIINVFRIPKVGTIAGCRVLDGVIRRDAEVKVMRGGEQLFKGKIGSLKRFKDDAREVASGMECGIGLSGFNDFKEGDLIEAFSTEKLAADLGALTTAKA